MTIMMDSELNTFVQGSLDKQSRIGLRVNFDRLSQIYGAQSEIVMKLQAEADVIVGGHINMGSRAQVACYLFDQQGHSSVDRSVSKEALAFVDDPFIPVYHAWTKARRGLSLVDTMQKFITDERVYSDWTATNETTGRIYCKDFNIQQLPWIYREAIIPDSGFFIYGDYVQFELTVLAALSGVQSLIEAVKGDAHWNTAERLYLVPRATLTDRHRQVGKMVNYAISYGITAAQLAARLAVPLAIAVGMVRAFYDGYPGLEEWIVEQKRLAYKNECVTTLSGHTRLLPGADWVADPERTGRRAINTLIQGSAADVLKQAFREVEMTGYIVKASVHDSLLVQDTHVDVYSQDALDYFQECMEITVNGVQFRTVAGIGSNWLAAKVACDQLSSEDLEE